MTEALPYLLCNEVVRDLDFGAQCHLAAALGYDGLEVAPFTLGPEPHRLPAARRAELRRAASDAGVRIGALHWLLVAPEGLSITTADGRVRAATLDVIERLVELCADLGGRVLVHGSPKQRELPEGDHAGAILRAHEAFAHAGRAAAAAGVVYCIEPLSRQETAFVNGVAEAVEIVEAIGEPALRTMVDCRAARLAEADAVEALLVRHVPSGMIRHVHLNDRNGRAPGQGDDRFAPVISALREVGYRGDVGVEPFAYEPDGPTTAARAIGYLRGLEEAWAAGAAPPRPPPRGEHRE
jgi:D-psicose/D-tagatose/L-ribulose 3-epimerase